MNYTPIVQDTSLPKAIICDIDGTLTRLGVRYDAEGNETTQGVRGKYEYERVGEDVLNEVNASFINKLNRDGFGEPFYCSIIYSTGRPTSSLNYTCKWLRKNI